MFTLFIDSHDKFIKLVIYKDNLVFDKLVEEATMNHSDCIMPLLDSLLKKNNISIHDIKNIIVVNGPGSFTGVRIGVTIAKMLAYTLNIPIRCVTSLECISVSNLYSSDKLCVVRDFKGLYGGVFNISNELIKEYFYLSNKEFECNDKLKEYKLFEDINYDFVKIYDFAMKKDPVISHLVNPLYIKVIEALK